MRKIVILISLYLVYIPVIAQSVQVVQLEHTLRWQTEYNFPNFLTDPFIEESMKNEISVRLRKIFPDRKIILPAHFDYRLISWFGKTKVNIPKSSSSDYQVAITSSITRATVGFSVLWKMKIQVKQNKKIFLDREVEHELDPYSYSIRFSNHPWLDSGEFMDTFLFLLDECLGITVFNPASISFGSPEIIRETIQEFMTIGKEYRLVVAGALMNQSRSSYKLMQDSLLINQFSYKPTDFLNFHFSISLKEIFADLFSQITGIEVYYTLNSKEHRTGAIFNEEGSSRQVRLDWLEENTVSTNDELLDTRIISPITGMYFDQDSMISHFIFYKETKPIENISLHDLQFQMDEDLYESIYAIRGTFKGTRFSVVYREYDELVLIKIENNLNAVLSLINVNQESMSSGGFKLTKNKTFLVPSKLMGRPDANESTAAWYPLYTISETADDTVIEMGYFLLLLFFAIGNAG